MRFKFAGVFSVVVCLVCLLPVGTYVYYMWFKFGFDEVSSQNADWSAFGSYLGGVLSPLFTLLSIAFIYYSIRENNSNHKTEMRYLESQQTISMVGSLADAFNAKLDSAVNLDHPLLKGEVISIYDAPDEERSVEAKEQEQEFSFDVDNSNTHGGAEPTAEVFQVKKTKMKLSDLLEDYMYFRDPKRAFSQHYVNLVSALTHDLVETLGVALAYCCTVERCDQRKEVVTLFNAKTNSTIIMVLMHLLADRIKYGFSIAEDIEDVEAFFASAATLADFSENYKYSSVPYMVVLLEKLVGDGFRNKSDEARFDFNRGGSTTISNGGCVDVVSAQKVLDGNDFEIEGVTVQLNANLNSVLWGCQTYINVEYLSNLKKFRVEIQTKNPFAEALGINAPLYVLVFSLEGLLFNLDEMEVIN